MKRLVGERERCISPFLQLSKSIGAWLLYIGLQRETLLIYMSLLHPNKVEKKKCRIYVYNLPLNYSLQYKTDEVQKRAEKKKFYWMRSCAYISATFLVITIYNNNNITCALLFYGGYRSSIVVALQPSSHLTKVQTDLSLVTSETDRLIIEHKTVFLLRRLKEIRSHGRTSFLCGRGQW